MKIKTSIVLPGRQNNQAWFAPSLAVIPGDKNKTPRVFVRVVQLTGNDIGPEHYLWTDNLGQTWTPPWESLTLTKIPLDDDVFEWPAFGLYYHKKSKSLLGLGTTLFSRDRGDELVLKSEVLVFDRKYSCVSTVWNPQTGDFQPWKKIPGLDDLLTPGCGQWHENDDGTILLPYIYYKPGEPRKVGTLKLTFDGGHLAVVSRGNAIGIEADEPSMIQFAGKFFMTIRSENRDHRMYHAESSDGMTWENYQPWCWDDGTPVETANTQQHWLKMKNDLYLIYTRKSELNNGVFRCRAPLFIANVDPNRLQLIRETETIVFPENGARMGNFSVANLSETEAWIMTGEWREQFVPGHRKGMRFWIDYHEGETPYNRMQYLGNLLLAKIQVEDK
jgi:hypothetical protein